MSMTDEDRRQEAALAPFFEAARKAAPAPSPDLMARVLEDAGAEQARYAAVVARPAAPRAGLWARITRALGGWPAMAGLGAAGLAGVWIGLALPETLPGLASATGDYVVDIAPDLALETGGGF
ncbi:hypothetical protein [Roseovarius ramblicola]|uniref:Dihydroorotate dehydrogenase n=1 Tax=Roseovarius ramblicola TaxID=2022336 RepID=A0ABV5I202_9RHOB